jgi:hypothetical protein
MPASFSPFLDQTLVFHIPLHAWLPLLENEYGTADCLSKIMFHSNLRNAKARRAVVCVHYNCQALTWAAFQMWYFHLYYKDWSTGISLMRFRAFRLLTKFTLCYYTSLQKNYLKGLPEEGNVPEVNFANKFSKYQKFTLTPHYLFKSTLMVKSENWWL